MTIDPELSYWKSQLKETYMKKYQIFIGVIIAAVVCAMLIWRFRKLSAEDIASIDAASISNVSAGAMITDPESGKISTFLLNDTEQYDQHAKAILKILENSEYRRDYRNLLPWGIRSMSSDKSYDGRTVTVSFSDGGYVIQLQLISSSLMLVSSSDETNMHIYHPANKNTFNELNEYIQTHGVEQ